MKSAIVAIALPLCLGACGGGEESADAEGCQHLEFGPSVAIIAAQDADLSAPAVADDHKRYDIALEEGDSTTKTGYVTFAPREATDFVFFLGQDVPLSVRDSDDANVAKEESAKSSPECDLIMGRHVAELEVGTYILGFGPTGASEVQLVIEEAGHEDEGE